MKKILLIAISILTLITPIYAADTGIVSVTATVLSRGNCIFRSKTANLDFGNLDPANPTDKTVSTTITYRCQAQGNSPVTFAVTDDDGLYETGPNALSLRMRHNTQPTVYLSYSLTINPTSGTVPKTQEFPLTITGTVKGVDYENAAMGSYSDIVTISIIP